jgi:hypothetical protein
MRRAYARPPCPPTTRPWTTLATRRPCMRSGENDAAPPSRRYAPPSCSTERTASARSCGAAECVACRQRCQGPRLSASTAAELPRALSPRPSAAALRRSQCHTPVPSSGPMGSDASASNARCGRWRRPCGRLCRSRRAGLPGGRCRRGPAPSSAAPAGCRRVRRPPRSARTPPSPRRRPRSRRTRAEAPQGVGEAGDRRLLTVPRGGRRALARVRCQGEAQGLEKGTCRDHH